MNKTRTVVRLLPLAGATTTPQYGENISSLNGLTVPSQFFLPAAESHEYWTGSRRLMLGVLQDAFASWFRYRQDQSKRGRRLFQETHGWFWSQEHTWLYAFESICEHLELDPNFIREQLIERQLSRSRRRKLTLRCQTISSSKNQALAA